MEGSTLEARDLWKTYDGTRYILAGVGLRVPARGVRVVWGRNGSGKTTLLNLLGTLDQPTRGQVIIGGTDLTAATEAERARARREVVGMVLQGPSLLEDLTVQENLALPPRIARCKGVAARVDRLIAEFGLQGLAHKTPAQLSAGQAQLVTVARAFANHPRILLADEPTASLDPTTTDLVLDIFEGAADEGMAVVIASHDLAVLRRFGPAFHLQGGRMVAPGEKRKQLADGI